MWGGGGEEGEGEEETDGSVRNESEEGGRRTPGTEEVGIGIFPPILGGVCCRANYGD